MEVLKQMDEILNSKNPQQPTRQKLTIDNPVIEPRVADEPPRVFAIPTITAHKAIPAPRVEKTSTSTQGPTARAKYRQALSNIVRRRKAPVFDMVEFALSILDNRPMVTREFAEEVFDEEFGRQLKYRQLITHPKHRDIWMHLSAN